MNALRQKKIVSIVKKVTPIPGPKKAMAVALREGLKEIKAIGSIVYLSSSEYDALESVVWTGIDSTDAEQPEDRKFPVTSRDQVKLWAHASLDRDEEDQQLDDNGNRLLFLPVIWETDRLAVICIVRAGPDRFNEADSEFIKELGRRLIPIIVRYQVWFYDTFEGIIISEKSRVVEFNNRASAILGYTRDEVIDKMSVTEIYAERSLADDVKARLERSNVIKHHYTNLKTKHGQKLQVHLHVQKLPNGQIIGRFSDRRRWLDGIEQIVSMMSKMPPDEESFMDAIVSSIMMISNCHSVGLLFPLLEENRFNSFALLRTGSQIIKDDKAYAAITLTEGICGKVYGSQPPLPDYAEDVNRTPYYWHGVERIRSEYCIPLIGDEGNIFGVLDLQSDVLDAFTLEDRQFLDTIAKTVAHLIAMFRAHSRQQEARLRHIQSAKNAAVAVLNNLKRDQVLDAILEQTRQSIKDKEGETPALAELLLLEGRKLKVVKRNLNNKHQPYNDQSRDLDEDKRGIVGRAIDEGKTQNIPNVDAESIKGEYMPTIEGIRSEIAVPVRDGKTIIGVLNLEDTNLNAFNKFDQEALEFFADLVAVAITNVGSVEKYYALLDRILPTIAPVHNMRRDFGNLTIYLSDVEERLIQLQSAGQIELNDELLIILRKAREFSDRIVYPNVDNPGPCDVDQTISKQIDSMQRTLEKSDIQIIFRTTDGQKEAVIHPYWLQFVLKILLDNAVDAIKMKREHSPFGMGKVEIHSSVRNNQVEIKIKDSGTGVSDDLKPKFFRELIHNGKGMGVGLYICYAILDAVKGTIQFEGISSEGGAIFGISLTEHWEKR